MPIIITPPEAPPEAKEESSVRKNTSSTDVVNPHFKLPFRWGSNGHAEVVEQDSPEDVTQCVYAILNTPVGHRLEIPAFGVRKAVLEENGPSLAMLEAALHEWEPRASYSLTDGQLEDILSRYVNVVVERKSDG
jgi:phage baseplate assembly protein W